jgi:hypothetical protein
VLWCVHGGFWQWRVLQCSTRMGCDCWLFVMSGGVFYDIAMFFSLGFLIDAAALCSYIEGASYNGMDLRSSAKQLAKWKL